MNKSETKKSKTENRTTEFKREGKSMKRSLTRFLTTTAALTLLMASVASAGFMSDPRFDVRPFTMGGEGVNMIMKSGSNIWLFPQFINQYPNQAEAVFQANEGGARLNSGGLSGETFPRFGVHFQFNEGNNPFVIGVYANNERASNPYDEFTWNKGRPFTGNTGSLRENREFNVFYGRNLGGNPFGAQLQVFNSNDESENTYRVGMTSVGLNLGLTTGGGAWDWAAGIGFTTFTDEAMAGTPAALTALSESDGNIYLKFSGRRWFPINSTVTWVAHGDVHYNKLGLVDMPGSTPGATEEWSNLMVMAGVGLNYTPTSKVHAVLDVRFDYSTLNHGEDTGASSIAVVDFDKNNFSIPPSYLIGVDGEVLSWLDFRAGASNTRSVLTREDNLGVITKKKESTSSTETFLGLGFHFGDLEVDTYVNPRFVINGPDFISGRSTGDLFMTAAATLHF